MLFISEAVITKLPDERRKIGRRGGEIENDVTASAAFAIEPGQRLVQAAEGLFVIKIAGKVIEPLSQPIPCARFDSFGGELIHVLAQAPAEFFVVHFGARHADYGKAVRQQAIASQVVERRN